MFALSPWTKVRSIQRVIDSRTPGTQGWSFLRSVQTECTELFTFAKQTNKQTHNYYCFTLTLKPSWEKNTHQSMILLQLSSIFTTFIFGNVPAWTKDTESTKSQQSLKDIVLLSYRHFTHSIWCHTANRIDFISLQKQPTGFYLDTPWKVWRNWKKTENPLSKQNQMWANMFCVQMERSKLIFKNQFLLSKFFG